MVASKLLSSMRVGEKGRGYTDSTQFRFPHVSKGFVAFTISAVT